GSLDGRRVRLPGGNGAPAVDAGGGGAGAAAPGAHRRRDRAQALRGQDVPRVAGPVPSLDVKSMATATPVILSGGSGTRLWPLSSATRPKQFHSLVGDETLIHATVRRVAGEESAPPLVVCNRAHVAEVVAQLEEAGS